MSKLSFRMAIALSALGLLVLAATFATEVRAQPPAVDPAATQSLQRMIDYVGSLQDAPPHRSVAWSTITAEVTSIAPCFKGTVLFM